MNLRALELNKQGIIPGPGETNEHFFSRADYCLLLKDLLKTKLSEHLPFSEAASIDETSVQNLYDIAPLWVPLFYSDYQLKTWQGGCAWIFQIDEKSPKTALIQLRKHFLNSTEYLHLYKKEEILVHELSHIGRLSFEEPKFEEFFAYRSSKSPFRKFFGPLFQSSFESLLFVLVLIMVLVLDLSILSLGSYKFYSLVLWTKIVPLSLFFAALMRLWTRHRKLNRCFEKCLKLTPSEQNANAVLYRLTDQEIITFSKMKQEEISSYIQNEEKTSLRWQVITQAYMY